jgi:predicted dehydrogenase
MSSSSPLILVIGCGSIGERHVRTFLATGRANVIACYNRPDIRRQMTERYGVETIPDWSTELGNPRITAAVIATPAPLHVDMARSCLEAGWHVLIEKPLSIGMDDIDRLVAAQAQAQRFTAIAYVLHFVPTLQAARQFIRSGAFGAVKHVAVNSGHHFPHARPAYREIYYRDHAQGGGAIQDALTHMANAVEWVIGPTSRIHCDAAHQVLDGVTVEDTVNASARNGDILVNYTLNQFQAVRETRLDFHAEKGTVRCEFHAQRWGTIALGETEWTWHEAPQTERDEMYISQAQAFLDGCEGRANPLCTLEEGIQTLRFNLAALKSWRENTSVVL